MHRLNSKSFKMSTSFPFTQMEPLDNLTETLGRHLPTIDYSVVTKYYPEKPEDPERVEKFRKILADGPHPLATNTTPQWWYFREPRDGKDVSIASTYHYPADNCVAQSPKWSPMFQLTHKYPSIVDTLRVLAFDLEQHNELWTQRSYGLYMLGRFEQAMCIADCVAYTSLSAPKPLSPQFHQQMTDTLARALFRTGHYHDALVVFLSQVAAGKEVDIDVLFASARCALGLGDWYLALGCLVQIARSHSRYARVWLDTHKLLLSLTHSILETALNAGADPCAPLGSLAAFAGTSPFTASPRTPLPSAPTPYHREDEETPDALLALAAQLWAVSLDSARTAPHTALVRLTADLLLALFATAHRTAAYAMSTNVEAHVGMGNHWNAAVLLALLDTPAAGYQRVHQPSGAFADAVPLSAGAETARVLRWGHADSVLLAGRPVVTDGAAGASVASGEVELEIPGVTSYQWHPLMDVPVAAPVAALRKGDRAHNHVSVCAAVDAAREAVVQLLERQYLLQEGQIRAAKAAREAQAAAAAGEQAADAAPASQAVASIDVGSVALSDTVVPRALRRVALLARAARNKHDWRRSAADAAAAACSVSDSREERCQSLWTHTALERVVGGSARCEQWLRRDGTAVAECVRAVHAAVGVPLRELVGAEAVDTPRMDKVWSPLMSVEACLKGMPCAAINVWQAEDKTRKNVVEGDLEVAGALAGADALTDDAMMGLITKAMMPKLAHAVFFGKLYGTPVTPTVVATQVKVATHEGISDSTVVEDTDDTNEVFTTTARPVAVGEVDEVDADGNLIRNRPRPMNPLAL